MATVEGVGLWTTADLRRLILKRAEEDPDSLVFEIPGEPLAQGRPRFVPVGRGYRGFHQRFRAVDPPNSRAWKTAAADLMALQRGGATRSENFPAGPLEVYVTAVFSLPLSRYRVRKPIDWRTPHSSTPDAENVAKAVLDAATKARVWKDDAQVNRLVVEKMYGAQDEAPLVRMVVWPI
jgi:Holliday junction resolvase RusA-like endonuclease